MESMNYKEEKLSNNLKILFLESELPLAGLLLFVNFGVRNETEESKGMAAFLTNLILRGSEKYPNDLSLGTILDNLGGYFNTEVQKEYTAFYIKLAGRKLGEAADFLAELVLNPVFVLSEVDREKKLCRQDIANREKNPELKAMDEFGKLIYGDHPLGYSGIANEKFLNSLKRDDLVSAHKKYYCGANMTLVVVAKKENWEKEKEKIKEAFSKLPEGKKQGFIPFEEKKAGGVKRVEFDSGLNVYITFGYPGLTRYNEKRRVLDFIESLLSRGRANERLLSLYIKRTPATAVRTTNLVFADFGVFMFQILAPRTTVRIAYQQAIEQLEMIKSRPISEEELNRMKNWYKGNLLIQISDPIEYGFFHGLSYLFNEGKIEGFEEVKEKIEKITSGDINSTAKKVFDQEKLSAVMLGKNLEEAR